MEKLQSGYQARQALKQRWLNVPSCYQFGERVTHAVIWRLSSDHRCWHSGLCIATSSVCCIAGYPRYDPSIPLYLFHTCYFTGLHGTYHHSRSIQSFSSTHVYFISTYNPSPDSLLDAHSSACSVWWAFVFRSLYVLPIIMHDFISLFNPSNFLDTL